MGEIKSVEPLTLNSDVNPPLNVIKHLSRPINYGDTLFFKQIYKFHIVFFIK